MSTNLNYKQVANVKRRTWDVDEYEQKAKERADAQDAAAEPTGLHANRKQSRRPQHHADDDEAARKRVKTGENGGGVGDEDNKEEFLPAEPGAAGPQGSERAFLQPRKGKVDISSKIGDTEMISAEAAAKTSLNEDGASSSIKDGVTKSGVGWHCSVCDCFLKDSMTYLDHINGRKHQRKLGFSMRVERSTKDQMIGRLSQLTKEKERTEKKMNTLQMETDYQEVVKQKDDDEAARKAEKIKRRQEKKKQKQLGPALPPPKKDEAEKEKDGDKPEEDEEEEEEGGVDPAMAAMMGFTGFT